MQAVAANREAAIPWGALASMALHGVVLLLVFLLLPPLEPPQVPPEESISVEMIPPPEASARQPQAPEPTNVPPPRPPADAVVTPEKPGELTALPAPSVAPRPPLIPAPAEPVPAEPAAPRGDGLVVAKQLFSDKILANPRSKKARQALGQLSSDERILQLCDLEALEQISRLRPGSSPDLVAPYAMKPEQMTSDGVEVKGGAFRAKKKWYGIQFKCSVDAHSGKVSSFAIALGDAIPEDEWQAHNLVADDGPAD